MERLYGYEGDSSFDSAEDLVFPVRCGDSRFFMEALGSVLAERSQEHCGQAVGYLGRAT